MRVSTINHRLRMNHHPPCGHLLPKEGMMREGYRLPTTDYRLLKPIAEKSSKI